MAGNLGFQTDQSQEPFDRSTTRRRRISPVAVSTAAWYASSSSRSHSIAHLMKRVAGEGESGDNRYPQDQAKFHDRELQVMVASGQPVVLYLTETVLQPRAPVKPVAPAEYRHFGVTHLGRHSILALLPRREIAIFGQEKSRHAAGSELRRSPMPDQRGWPDPANPGVPKNRREFGQHQIVNERGANRYAT